MKNWLAFTPLCFCALSFNVFSQECSDVVFRAKTMDHKKEILLCHVNNKIIYSHGKVNEHPDAVISTCMKDATYSYEFSSKRGRMTLILPNEDLNLNFIISITAGIFNVESDLVVVDNGRPSMVESIDPKTISGGIEEGFSKYGIPERMTY